MEEALRNIFANVNDYLKFAEAKNGLILTLNGGLIFGILSIFKNQIQVFNRNTPVGDLMFRLYLWEMLILSFVSLVVALISLLPQLKTLKSKKPNRPKTVPKQYNLVYFGDIIKYTDAYEYLKDLSPEKKEFKNIEVAYANEIIYNSRIAYTKYKLFNFALFLMIGAFATVLVSITVYLFCHMRKNT